MIKYKDKYNKRILENDYVYVDEKVCKVMTCEDGTTLYEELYYSNSLGDLDVADEPLYPDAYTSDEVEVISKERAIEILKAKNESL